MNKFLLPYGGSLSWSAKQTPTSDSGVFTQLIPSDVI